MNDYSTFWGNFMQSYSSFFSINHFNTKHLSLALSALSLSILTACQPANKPANPSEANSASQASVSNTFNNTASTPANNGKLMVYTSTNVWGSVAKAVGGDKVEVISAVNDPTQDPHDYQASATDKLNVSKAQLVLVNGGGYDDWTTSLANSVANRPVIINAVDLSGLMPAEAHDEHEHETTETHDHADDHHDEHVHEHKHHHHHSEFNEHVFFSLDTAKKVAQAVANNLSAKDPANKAMYAQNAQQFMQQLDGLKSKAQAIGKDKNLTAFATEPVTGYLLADIGIKDLTPKAYIEQSETDAGVSVKVLNDSKNLLSSKQAKLMVVNAQTEDETAKTLMAVAKQAGIPVIAVNETFPAGVTSYTDFIEKTLTDFANAVK